MKYAKMNLFIIIVTSAFILVPSFALISSSQTNDTSSDDTSSDDTSSDDTSSDDSSSNQSAFSTMSRELANQSEPDGQFSEDGK
jgi:hypothetical protein